MGKVYPRKSRARPWSSTGWTTRRHMRSGSTSGISAASIRNWRRQASRDEGRLSDGGLTSDERARLVALERDQLRFLPAARHERAVQRSSCA
jgi:hypothetical protein